MSSTAVARITDRPKVVTLNTQVSVSPVVLLEKGQRALSGERVGMRDQREIEEERERKVVGAETRRR